MEDEKQARVQKPSFQRKTCTKIVDICHLLLEGCKNISKLIIHAHNCLQISTTIEYLTNMTQATLRHMLTLQPEITEHYNAKNYECLNKGTYFSPFVVNLDVEVREINNG